MYHISPTNQYVHIFLTKLYTRFPLNRVDPVSLQLPVDQVLHYFPFLQRIHNYNKITAKTDRNLKLYTVKPV